MGRPSLSLFASFVGLAALAGALWGALSRLDIPSRSVPARPAPAVIAPGSALDRDLRRGAVDLYQARLRGREYLHLVVEQRGVDLVVRLRDPSGREILDVDTPSGRQGPEDLFYVARLPGLYGVEVLALDRRSGGRYRIRIAELRRATEEDRSRAAAAAEFSRAERVSTRGSARELRDALDLYRSALGRWRVSGALREAAMALRRIGQVSFRLGDLRAAAEAWQEALPILRQLSDLREEARVLTELGTAHRLLSETADAEADDQRALGIARQLGDPGGEALALNNLGVLYDSMSEPQKALDSYERALALWRSLGEKAHTAATLHNLGTVYSILGRPREALDLLREALQLQRAAGDRRGEAATLTSIAWVCSSAGAPLRSLALYDEALALWHQVGDALGEAGAFGRRGAVLARLGRSGEALDSYRRALAVFRREGDRSAEAFLLLASGEVLESRAAAQEARSEQEAALDLFRQIGERNGEAFALLALARGERRRGALEAALAHAEEALHRVEDLRGRTADPTMRTFYLASRYDHYELCMDLEMLLEERAPRRGHAARAFEVSERARARGLLDLIGGLPRRGGPAPEPLGLAGVQALLDRDTLLLEYALGEERSVLWLVGPDSLVSRELPPRSVIERQARRVHELLAESHKRGKRTQAELEAAALADLILGPVADRLGHQRLVIVADGALQYVPFAALPVASPGRSAVRSPLLVSHEVVHLPSASVLAQLRRRMVSRSRPPHLLAVVADPVFGRSDARPRQISTPERSTETPGLQDLPPLPHTRREAEAILSLVPPQERFEALGFAATRETVLSGRLSLYRIVHLATHGWLDLEHPELSGLVLSLVDEQGRARDGFLRVHEVCDLNLPADLVVLSACRTALGREVRGEGLIGLAGGFFQAGAARVLMSLWSVDDEATAELMRRFYEGVLRRGLPPARALREAQLSFLREPHREAPSFWAGFLLQGEWR